MKNRRWSDQNWHLWPFTLSYSKYKFAGMTLSSGAREGGKGDCYISVYAFGWWLACELPRIIPHYRERHVVQHGREDFIARMGRDWYDELFSREYGFSFSGEGSLHVYYGPQTHSSDTTKSRCIFLPWLSWRFIRHSHTEPLLIHYGPIYDRPLGASLALCSPVGGFATMSNHWPSVNCERCKDKGFYL